MDNISSEIALLFRQRIVPGVYQFDIVITNSFHCGAVIGTIIHGKEKVMVSISSDLESEREKITKKTYEICEGLKEMFGD